MRPLPIVLLLLASLASVCTAGAADLAVLTRGKVLRLDAGSDPGKSRGLVRFGHDAALAAAPDPSCPSASAFDLGLFTVAANAVVRNEKVALECAKWRKTRTGWRYDDPDAAGGVRRITYGPRGLAVRLVGPAAMPAPGPVGYAFVWFEVGAMRFHGRFHVFEANTADRVRSRRLSKAAGDGETRFWAIMWGDDASETAVQETSALLQRAAKRSKADARSRFLLGMLHLYRFGQLTERFSAASEAGRAEIAAAVAAFDDAEPLLWNRTTRVGDSRMPGFAAAARYALAVVTADEALRQRALADLAYAVEINAFFNVFDLMTVLQAEPAGSSAFQQAFADLSAYIGDPNTLACAVTQPEVCTNAGLAPTALPGTFVMFGDAYAKSGDAATAKYWYQFGIAAEAGWAFEGLAAERLAGADARVAAYQDVDPANDPPIIGAGPEACASCHHRPLTGE
ncbi:MAG TPA: hypothetical protein VMS22_12830 [Candidatus Eisenbacteria bacterium]|nr:hypothetical protein [Candidatus Eisenbacteria bacterium]